MPKIILENSYAENYKVLGNLTWHSNKVKYAERHGYGINLNIYENNHPIPHGFHKIFNVKKLLEQCEADWIWVTGCDSMITNFTKPVENLIDENYDFLLAKDQRGINMDSFLVKNSVKAHTFLQFIIDNYENYKNHHWAEQQCVIDNEHKFIDTIKIIPQRAFNSYNYDLCGNDLSKPNLDGLGFDGNWQPGDLLIHWPDVPLNKRLKLFERYSSHIIS